MPLVLSGTNGISTNGINWALTPDSSGRVNMPSQTAVNVRMSGTQSIASNTRTKVAFDTVDNQVGSSYSTGNYRFTAPVAGWYSIHAHVYIYPVNQAEVFIFKNGSIFIRVASANVSQTNPHGSQVNHIIYLAANDYIEIFAEQQSGSTQTIYTSSDRPSYLSIRLNG